MTAVKEGDDTFKLLGVIVDTSQLQQGTGLQDSDFEGVDDENILRSTFYQALQNATAPGVKAKGTYNPLTKTLTACEVELQFDD